MTRPTPGCECCARKRRNTYVRKALNERTSEFGDALPPELRKRFVGLMLECIAVLDGAADDEVAT